MNPNESPNWKQRAEKAIAELKLVSDVLLATDYNVQGTAYPPNLVARAELLIVERAKLRAANEKAIAERDAALAACAEMREILDRSEHLFTASAFPPYERNHRNDICPKCRWDKSKLSFPCGQGFVSLERVKGLVEALELARETLRQVHAGMNDNVARTLGSLSAILAAYKAQ